MRRLKKNFDKILFKYLMFSDPTVLFHTSSVYILPEDN